MVHAGIPYDLLQRIQLGAKVNVLVTEGNSVSFSIYIDEACTQELTEPVNFGSVPQGGSSDLRHIYIKNTGTSAGTVSDIRTDTSGFKIVWGFGGSTTLHPGDTVHIWLRLQVDPDISAGIHDFEIVIDVAGGTSESW